MSRLLEYPQIKWPDGKAFAFTIFDDTDLATVENVKPVYDLLRDWIPDHQVDLADAPPEDGEVDRNGSTCADPDYVSWLSELQSQGFEIGYHLAAGCTSPRDQTRIGLDRFHELFGPEPITMSNHMDNKDGIYFGADRLSGVRRLAYKLYQNARGMGPTRGHLRGDPLFWGDLCSERVEYVRNFVFPDINTLKACPVMPYHDSARPYVRSWFASSEGPHVEVFNATLAEANQDRLVREGGACIMYTHLAVRFFQDGRLNPRFESLMRRLAGLGGWFVPVRTLLKFLASVRGEHTLTPRERVLLEWRWLLHKARVGPT